MEQTPTYSPPAGDNADWRLIAYLDTTGMKAYLKNEANPDESLRSVCNMKWNTDNTSLLKALEDTVYDNPTLLDDYEADFIVRTPRTILAPSSCIQDPEHSYLIYSAFYPDADDPFADILDDAGCLYEIARGVKAFLRRTMPGVRVTSHLSVFIRWMRNNPVGERLHINLTPAHADMIFVDGKKLLKAVSYPWKAAEDLVYYAINLIRVAGFDENKVMVTLSGASDLRRNVVHTLRDNIETVTLATLPRIASDDTIPTEVALAIAHKYTTIQK